MDSLLSWIGVASLALLIVASAVAWWEHRVRINQLRRDLALVENSRFMMEEQLRSVDARLQSMQVRMDAQKVQRSQPAGPPVAVEHAASAEALAAATSGGPLAGVAVIGPSSGPSPAHASGQFAGSAASTQARSRRPQVWADTLPMEALIQTPPPHYEATRPMDLPER